MIKLPKLPIWIKNFSGIKIQVLTLEFNRFDGYGFTLLSIGWSYRKGFNFSNSRPLLHFNVYHDTSRKGDVWRFSGGILFLFRGKIFEKVVKEPLERCDWCDEWIEGEKYLYEDEVYCSSECRGYAH